MAGQAPDTAGRPTLLATLPPGTEALPVAFADLPGWDADDHAAAFAAFLAGCPPILDGAATLRDALSPDEALVRACRKARDLAAAGPLGKAGARAFFETGFRAFDIRPAGRRGFLTAYFEPEVPAARRQSAAFPEPALARPADLLTLKQGETRPGLDASLSAARIAAEGLQPYPDRAAIWAGALAGQGLEIAWLKDKAELFIIQVQGSARLKFDEGGQARLVYAGRNGLPYTSIGRKLVERGEMALDSMTLAGLMAWLRADAARGQRLMEENRSFVFFALDETAPVDRGPIGGAGVPLSAGRSLAIDRQIWPYGLPVWIEVAPLTPAGPRERLDRLMIAQDTGSAIVGPARGDFYMGSGEAAGERAGLVRDAMRFVVLVPVE